MVLEILEIAVRDGQDAAFEAALCEVRQRVFMSPGFRGFTVAQGLEDSAVYLVDVLWESREELADFTDSGRAERCWAPVDACLAERPRVGHLLERPGLTLQG